MSRLFKAVFIQLPTMGLVSYLRIVFTCGHRRCILSARIPGVLYHFHVTPPPSHNVTNRLYKIFCGYWPTFPKGERDFFEAFLELVGNRSSIIFFYQILRSRRLNYLEMFLHEIFRPSIGNLNESLCLNILFSLHVYRERGIVDSEEARWSPEIARSERTDINFIRVQKLFYGRTPRAVWPPYRR